MYAAVLTSCAFPLTLLDFWAGHKTGHEPTRGGLGWNPASNSEAGGQSLEGQGTGGEDASELRLGQMSSPSENSGEPQRA